MTREKLLEDRYKERLREAIKQKLPTIIANESILENPKDKIKVRIPFLDEPYFKPRSPKGAAGGGGQSGQTPGDAPADYELEVELDIEELAELLFQTLGLPRLKPKGEYEQEETRVQGTTRSGPRSRLHRKKTAIEFYKTGQLTDNVLRFRDIRTITQHKIKADVYLARDFSASMDETKRFKVRSMAFWILRFLRRTYPFVRLHFVLHDTAAFFTDEDTFFKAGTGGGTKISSCFALIEEDIREKKDLETNYYIFYFSDGENIETDNPVVLELIKGLLRTVNLIGYAEIGSKDGWISGYSFTLSKYLHSQKLRGELDGLKISVTTSVRKTLEDFFGQEAVKDD